MKTKLTDQEKTARAEARRAEREAKKELQRIEDEKNQKPVKCIDIAIEWKKSRTWGSNPHLSANVRHEDGTITRYDGITCSGCGYDKESTVIAELYNETLKYKLWQIPKDRLKGGNGSNDVGSAPYGIHLYSDNRPHFGGGIGTNCYYKITEYLGGKFEHVSSGKMFDVYRVTF